MNQDPCKLNCNECHKELEAALCDIPSAWRKQIVDYFCKFVDRGICCTDVIKCINNEMEQLDFDCLAESQTEWNNLTFQQKLQRLIDRICEALSGQLGPDLEIRSDSLVVTAGGTQGHEPRIELVPSDDDGNILTLGSDGLPYVPESENICDQLSNFENLDQLNSLPQEYGFVLSNCKLASPPTGFAIQGDSRRSAFGKMEWFETLTDANDNVNQGESILLFQSADESITAIENVVYLGIGNVSVSEITSSVNCKVINLTLDNLISSGNSKIEATAVTVKNTFRIEDNSEVSGVRAECLTRVIDNSKLFNSTILGPVEVENNGTLDNCNVYNNENSNYGVFALTVQDGTKVTVSNCTITSSTTTALFARAEGVDSTLNIINNTCISVSSSGLAVVTSNSTNRYNVNIVGNTASSEDSSGIYIEGAVQVDEIPLRNSQNFWNVFNNNGISINAEGILAFSARLTSCKGSSQQGPGIKFLGEISRNVGLVDCIGESYNANGLLCSTNCFVNGGTYITYRTIKDILASPIYLDSMTTSGAYILNVTTISRDSTQYAIRASAATSVKIINCTMTSETGLTSAGIDPLITNTASASHVIDVYGNFK